VAIVLALIFATLPRLLDSYFAQQSTEDLQRRTNTVSFFVLRRLLDYQTGSGEAARPILQPTQPLTAAPGVYETFGNAADGYVLELVRTIAQADITITIAEDRDHVDQPAYELFVPAPDDVGQGGQKREGLAGNPRPLEIRDLFWTQAGAAAPERVVTVTLSNPFTYRSQTLENLAGVLGVTTVLALIAAVITSVLIADRLANPIRRLTSAARELSEGHLDTRVPTPGSSPEMSDLTAAFNSMAERVQDSIEFIRRDRDRSRDFLADVSHELRTPIAALRTFNELLTEGQVPDEATRQEFLEQSRAQIERLDWLASNLLELSKLDSGLVLLDLRPDDLRAVVENAVHQAQPSAERKGVSISVNLPEEALRQRHDPQRMGQVLGNLVGNAIKFTPSGGHVEVSLGASDGGAEFRVTDDGVGIDPQELPFVFDRFYRGSQASEPRATGSGLGLSIVRSIVEMHNGRVAVTSTPGSGTQVSVFLPADVSVSSPGAVRA
jgi:signal transduction histidine kinase